MRYVKCCMVSSVSSTGVWEFVLLELWDRRDATNNVCNSGACSMGGGSRQTSCKSYRASIIEQTKSGAIQTMLRLQFILKVQ